MSLLSVALLLSAQPVPLPLETQRVRGRVICDQDGSPIRSAEVVDVGVQASLIAALTDESGSFELPVPRVRAVRESQDCASRFLRVSAAKHATSFVDACSTAPWADRIRLRPTAYLTINLGSPRRGPEVIVTIDSAELCWPPRSGLTVDDEVRRSSAWADCRLSFGRLPAQVPIFVSLDREKLGTFVVLQPGEDREMDLKALYTGRDRFGPEPRSYSDYVSVYPSVSEGVGEPELTWFTILTGGGRSAHGADGGHWRVHRYRACNHLGFLPGRSTLVARDARGWIGATPIEAAETDEAIRPHVTLGPGAMLRLDASHLAAPAHVKLSSSGVAFVEIDLLPGVVRYEVVPAGAVQVTVEVEGHNIQKHELTTTPGASTDLKL